MEHNIADFRKANIGKLMRSHMNVVCARMVLRFVPICEGISCSTIYEPTG